MLNIKHFLTPHIQTSYFKIIRYIDQLNQNSNRIIQKYKLSFFNIGLLINANDM